MPGLGSVASSRPKNQAIQEGEWPLAPMERAGPPGCHQ
jgi:hypothetical protein